MTEVEQCKLVERGRMLAAMLHWACLHDRAMGGNMLKGYPTIASWFELNSKNQIADDLLKPMQALETIRSTYGWNSGGLLNVIDAGVTAMLQRQANWADQAAPMTTAKKAVSKADVMGDVMAQVKQDMDEQLDSMRANAMRDKKTAEERASLLKVLDDVQVGHSWNADDMLRLVGMGTLALENFKHTSPAAEASKQKPFRKVGPGAPPPPLPPPPPGAARFADAVDKLADKMEEFLRAEDAKAKVKGDESLIETIDRQKREAKMSRKDETLEEAAQRLTRKPYESIDEMTERIMRTVHGVVDRACDKAKEPDPVKPVPSQSARSSFWTTLYAVLMSAAVAGVLLFFFPPDATPSRVRPTVPVTRAAQSLTVAIKERDKLIQRSIERTLDAIDSEAERGRRVLFCPNKDDLVAQGRWSRAIRDKGYAVEPWGKNYQRVTW